MIQELIAILNTKQPSSISDFSGMRGGDRRAGVSAVADGGPI